ncbi:MAG TPA: peptidyl-tRNA hydrolase [Jatrophihabitantaceae bacterium]|jgi:peptidyl-tRNA hydrolase|nr:peptidyl-tRNA hydrolase [Jatrophihabitantaceae bacterium]
MPELVLPLVIRIERDRPPTRTDALEAAARGVLLMLTTEEAAWAADVALWDGQRMRKVVRRARGTQWQRAAQLPGLTVRHGSAELRVYPPIPTDDWPDALARLQVGGTELDDPDAPPAPAAQVPLVLLSPVAQMTAGKSMAQAGHAAQLGWWASSAADRARWREQGFPLAVRVASLEQWSDALRHGLPVVHDGGFTEVEPNTRTATVVLPWLDQRSDS